jgi:hypoxanthine phosphoribosyltransferase
MAGLTWEYAVLNFRTISDLNIAIVNNLHEIRKLKIDLVVGIPRSGMLPATLIATHLQLPFTDIDSYNSNRWYVRHKKLTVATDRPATALRVLLVDDTINTGHAMRAAVNTLTNSIDTVIKFAVFGSAKNNPEDIDFVCEDCPLPRAFQWNIWKHKSASNWATDMDGVMCRDPSKKENDKGPRLENFYKTADPKFLYTHPIKYVITSREERFRSITETWLHQHNIQYTRLIMKPNGVPGGNESHAEYKANTISKLNDIELYIESDPKQAKIMSNLINIPIWSIDDQRLY